MTVQRRAWWLAAAVLVIVLVVTGAVFLVRGGDDVPSAQACRLVTPPSGTAPAADGGGLRIVEQGFSLVPSPTVSMGAVIENTTDKVAYRTRVTFDVLGTGGESVVHSWHRPRLVQEVPIILPGAKVSVGDAVALIDATRGKDDPVARISIIPVVTQWLAAGDGNNGLAPVTAKAVPGGGKRDDDGSGFIAYTAESANCAPLLSRGTSLVFRDASGKIVGGNVDGARALAACKPSATSSEESANAGLRAIPATADLNQTDVTAYCDFAQPVPTGQSGEPIN
jgi:hypothetical protein